MQFAAEAKSLTSQKDSVMMEPSTPCILKLGKSAAFLNVAI